MTLSVLLAQIITLSASMPVIAIKTSWMQARMHEWKLSVELEDQSMIMRSSRWMLRKF